MNFSKLDKYKDFGLLIIRLGLGGMYLYHGVPKVMGGPALWEKLGMATQFVGIDFAPLFFGLSAALAESVGGALLILGLFFRPALFFLITTMAVAAAMHLGKGDGLAVASHAIENAITFTGLFFIGPGKYSVGKG